MLAEAREALHGIRVVATTPAGEAGVRRVVGARFGLYPQAQMSEGQWAAWWRDYYETLSDLAEVALEAGMAAHVADPKSEFLPKPGRLRELALRSPNRTVRAYDRITTALRLTAEAAQPVKERVPKEQVDALLAEFRAQAAARKEANKRPPLPPWHGKTDETGITEEMKRLLGSKLPADDNGLRGFAK